MKLGYKALTCVLLLMLMLPLSASATLVHQGVIETNGTVSTVDQIYFTTSTGGAGALSLFNIQALIGNPFGGFHLYADDGSLDISDHLASSTFESVSTTLAYTFAAATSYVMVIGEWDLGVGDFGPTYFASCCSDDSFSYDADIRLDGVTVTQVREGTLEGTWGQVPEPATLALMGLGLAGIGFARKKKAA